MEAASAGRHNSSTTEISAGNYSSTHKLFCGFPGVTSDQICRDFRGTKWRNVSQALVLDSEKGELVRAPPSAGKKAVPEEKVIAALRNHSDAERRRRERINSHLETLRQLLPCRQKMDKATLLAEVIKQVRELEEKACEASKGFVIPMDDNEVKVEQLNCEANGTWSFKSTLCCEYSAEAMVGLQQAFDVHELEIVRSEVSTVEGRMQNEVVFTHPRIVGQSDHVESLKSSVRRALNSVVEKAIMMPEYDLPRGNSMIKRQRVL